MLSEKKDRWYNIDMDDVTLRSIIMIRGLKTESASLIMTKQQMVDLLNENARKIIKIQQDFPETSSTQTKVVELKSSSSSQDDMPSLEKDPGLASISSSSSSSQVEEAKPCEQKIDATINPNITHDSINDNILRTVSKKNSELAKIIGSASEATKKTVLNTHRKAYCKWFQEYITEQFFNYCGPHDNYDIVGTNTRLPYNLEVLEWLSTVLESALHLCAEIEGFTRFELLLTDAKQGRLISFVEQMAVIHAIYYKYVFKQKGVDSEEDLARFYKTCKAEINQIPKINKGSKKLIQKLLDNYHLALTSEDGIPVKKKKSAAKKATDSSKTKKKKKVTLKKKKKKSDDIEDDDDEDEPIYDEDNSSYDSDAAEPKVVVKKKKKKKVAAASSTTATSQK